MDASDLTIFSVIYDVGLLAFSIFWLFTTQTYYDKCCPVFLLPLLTSVVIAFSRKNLDKTRSANIIKLNLATLGLIILVAAARYYWDFDFILHSKEYASTLETVKSSRPDFSQDNGYEINLPSRYRHLAYNGEVIVKNDNGDLSFIFPITPGDLDGILNAYVYADERHGLRLPKICTTGHSINPPNENWFYCTAGERQIHE